MNRIIVEYKFVLLSCILYLTHALDPNLVDFDCKIRALGVEYATTIQPYRSKDDIQQLTDALYRKGGKPFGPTLCNNTYDGVNHVPTSMPLKDISKDNHQIYVDAQNGNDKSDGTKEKPLKSIQQAITALRKVSKKSTRGKASIILRQGVHYLKEQINLEPIDSNITILPYKKEKVVISGAKAVGSDANWKKSKLQQDLWELEIQNVKEVTGLRIGGKRAVRARYPNGCDSTKPDKSGFICQGFSKNGEVVNPIDGFGSERYTNFVPHGHVGMSQENWREVHYESPRRTSGGTFQTFSIGIGGTCSVFSPPAGYWCGTKCEGGAPPPPDCIFRNPRGIFNYAQSLPNSPYKNPKGAVVHTWRPGHWSSWMFEVGQGNATHLMFSKGGFQGSRGSNGAVEFFIENVFEELDAYNEFFYNATTGILYYKSVKRPHGVVEVPTLKTLFDIRGTQKNPVHDISFHGLEIIDAAVTFLDPHSAPSGGDWAVGSHAAIRAQGVKNLSVQYCNLHRLDGNGILLVGYARNALIKGNRFYEIGENMFAQLGHTKGEGIPDEYGMGWDGRDGNQPRGTHFVENFGSKCGLFEKQSSMFFQAKSMESVILNNIAFDLPRAAINFNDGFGGGNLMQGNLLFNTVMESSDHGPFNSWDREPYAYESNPDGSPNLVKRFDHIARNFLFGNYYAQLAIDNDDGSCNYEAHHNVIVYGQHGGIKSDFGGHDNYHHHNLYAFPHATILLSTDSQIKGHEDVSHDNKVVSLPGSTYAKYGCKCKTDPKSSCPKLYNNQIYLPPKTPPPKICGETWEERQRNGMDVGSTLHPLPDTNTIVGWAKELLFGNEAETLSNKINRVSSIPMEAFAQEE